MDMGKLRKVLSEFKEGKLDEDKAIDKILGIADEVSMAVNDCFNCRHHGKHGLSCAYCKYGSNWQEIKE